jgi:hypothetical protein
MSVGGQSHNSGATELRDLSSTIDADDDAAVHVSALQRSRLFVASVLFSMCKGFETSVLLIGVNNLVEFLQLLGFAFYDKLTVPFPWNAGTTGASRLVCRFFCARFFFFFSCAICPRWKPFHSHLRSLDLSTDWLAAISNAFRLCTYLPGTVFWSSRCLVYHTPCIQSHVIISPISFPPRPTAIDSHRRPLAR